MILYRSLRRFAALAAMSGIALQALLPAIVQAAPKDSISVPICSVDGTRHEIQLPLGNKQTEKSAEHCKLCLLGTDKPAVSNPATAFLSFMGKCEAVQSFPSVSVPSSAGLAARPRAPPAA
jgi:hypothetical protein